MGKTITLKNIDEVFDIIKEIDMNDDIGRHRSGTIYRGLPRDSYSLVTSIKRNCESMWKELEKPMLRNFYKYAITESQYIKNSEWEKMIIGQHHGLPTRLLDWSYSPLVALHFATLENDCSDIDKYDCIIWKIDIDELHKAEKIPTKCRKMLDDKKAYIFTVDMLDELYKEIDDYDDDMKNKKSMLIIEPPSIDSRIVNQYSYFTIIPKWIDDDGKTIDEVLMQNEKTIKYIIPKEIRWELRELLDRSNINERIAYPGLEGISMWLKRHYFHKDKI